MKLAVRAIRALGEARCSLLAPTLLELTFAFKQAGGPDVEDDFFVSRLDDCYRFQNEHAG